MPVTASAPMLSCPRILLRARRKQRKRAQTKTGLKSPTWMHCASEHLKQVKGECRERGEKHVGTIQMVLRVSVQVKRSVKATVLDWHMVVMNGSLFEFHGLSILDSYVHITADFSIGHFTRSVSRDAVVQTPNVPLPGKRDANLGTIMSPRRQRKQSKDFGRSRS